MGFLKMGKVESALEIFHDMEGWGIFPDIVTYNTMLRGFCDAGDLEQALNLVERMRKEGRQLDAIAYSALSDAMGRAGRMGDLEKLMSQSMEVGVQYNS
ncbi:Pentatricopeptide repeat-containing protein [Acorus calamus]|uniref:Pentatricopeptide repeat-containing protein n=1 Tax=Acorus calamus TaxID=4465 RepID=A0AAV9C961_ACOCL|nr:Pentatricopeptide repeat-containing protein [Acorus calamus]